jgi:ribosomal protein L21
MLYLKNCADIIRCGLNQRKTRCQYYRRKEDQSQDQGERQRLPQLIVNYIFPFSGLLNR